MRKYLSTLHKKSDEHKKRFALAVSGGFTLLIFGIWTAVNFGPEASKEEVIANEVSPFESFQDSVANSFEALKTNFGELKDGFGSLDQYVR